MRLRLWDCIGKYYFVKENNIYTFLVLFINIFYTENIFFYWNNGMYFHKKGSSIIEAMVVLMIITTGVTWVYLLMSSSQKLANATGNRIEAIQIARDGLEAMTNIRDTNWILYGADPANCWNVMNYSGSCVGDTGTGRDISHTATGWLKISRDSNNRFFPEIRDHGWNNDYTDSGYLWLFEVFKDTRWFYTQNTGSWFFPRYTREIQVSYFEDTNGDTFINSNDAKMKVIAIVQWQDPGSSDIKKVEMDTLLTNWKK